MLKRLWCRLFGCWMEERSDVYFVGVVECYCVWYECTVCGRKEQF